jgi:hypothetical protein
LNGSDCTGLPTTWSRPSPKKRVQASFTAVTTPSSSRRYIIGIGLSPKMRAKSSREARSSISASICAVTSRPTPR